jgi:serine/threonine protein kinase
MKAGDRIGDYVIEGSISVEKTGQGDVFRGRRYDGTGMPVAIKVLAERLKSDRRSIRNFEQEADLLTKLNHRNIVCLEAFDTSPPTPYIAQEYIQGRSVAELLEQSDGPLSFSAVLQIALQVTDALSYAHGLKYFEIKGTKKGGKSSRKRTGIIHKDLSTDNILITETGEVKLIDFGIARAVGLTTITTTTSIGKGFYMAPEIELGSRAALSTAVDIYSFGVCLYELVMTWRPERKRIGVLKQFQRTLHHLYAAFPDDVPEDLKRLIVQCVQREPSDRPQSIDEVKDRLSGIQEQLASVKADVIGMPEGLIVRSELLSFDYLLKLGEKNAGDFSMRAALNEEETKVFLLCDGQTKVRLFNLSGGEKQVHHVPHGKQLTALAGIKGEQVLGLLAGRQGFMLLDEIGEWHTMEIGTDMGEPRIVPDNLILQGRSVYVGDYDANQICRFLIDDGTRAGVTPEQRITQLGPFVISGESLLCIDMALKVLLKADMELKHIGEVASIGNCDWPTSLTSNKNLLFVVDSQKRRLSIITADGYIVDLDALTWSGELNISQVMFSQRASQLVALETSMPALAFFNVQDVDMEVVRISNVVRGFGIEVRRVAYQAIEKCVLTSIEKHVSRREFALKIVDKLKRTPGTGRKGESLQVAVYSLLPCIVPPDERRSLLRSVAREVEELGECERAKQLYLEYLSEVKGYDPDVRDRYVRLLEQGEKWQEIRDFEGEFLQQSYFKDYPDNRLPYDRSYQWVRKAYTKLGMPIPKDLRVPPTSELAKARNLLDSGAYDEARRVFAEIIENEGYKQMKPVDAIAALAGYADSIKRSSHVLTVEDWKDVCSSLSILVHEYSEKEGFDQEYSRDLIAARRQVEKLEGSIPSPGKSEPRI